MLARLLESQYSISGPDQQVLLSEAIGLPVLAGGLEGFKDDLGARKVDQVIQLSFPSFAEVSLEIIEVSYAPCP